MFAGEEFADRAAQHRAAVAAARVGRAPGALELDLVPALRAFMLAQQQCAAVAELAGPVAELVPAVDAGQRPGAGQQRVAGEGGHQLALIGGHSAAFDVADRAATAVAVGVVVHHAARHRPGVPGLFA
mgnify:CR=1 FL=1